ncbi:MAG: 4Fe-4S ferredoxin [Betaproteobacteria bacterium RIFCSPLOWO2_12_FULL_63_13]|nr:MAG: 4Fe-4S ferredoxin [Betaproteobacteria bacterium RIFCSPLOWO2_12_FULL_63_13]
MALSVKLAEGRAVRWGVAVDLKRCVGCQSCTVACKAQNGTPPGIFWTRVIEKEEGSYPFAYTVFMPLRCNHCSEPPCVPVCPTGASYQRETDNVVLVDQDQCVGCHACVVACPYEARFIATSAQGYYGKNPTPYEQVSYRKWQVGTAQKCTLCVDRLDAGLQPVCIDTCPTRALSIGDLNDAHSEISKLIAKRPRFRPSVELGADPNVYYLT